MNIAYDFQAHWDIQMKDSGLAIFGHKNDCHQ